MRIFLAPPYFLQRTCRHCVRLFYRENPDSWWWQYEMERMPPLGTYESGQGFIPDYAVLTMFDEFVIDEVAYERLTSKRTPKWFGAWPNVIQLLNAEGALSTVNTTRELAQTGRARGSMLRRDMKDVSRWADAMNYYSTLFASADRALSPVATPSMNFAWDYDPAETPGTVGSDGKYHDLAALPLTEPGKDSQDPHFELHETALEELRDQLQEVNAGISIAAQLNCAPMFWAPYRLYLEQKTASTNQQTEAPRLFFKIAFPRYQPSSVKDLKRLRQDRRARQLREVILSAAQSGDVMDPKYPQRILEEVFRLEKKIGQVRQIISWISSAIGLVPVPGLGLATTVVGELASTGIEQWLRKDWHWFYLISDGTGYS